MATHTLPLDIIFSGIFPKLPVKSLLRFKSVSKSFNSEISSPEFIKLQHHHTLSSDDNCLLILPDKDRKAFVIYDYDTPNITFSRFSFAKSVDFSFEVVASCECYLLIIGDFIRLDTLMLLNPATRNYRELPYDCSKRPWVAFGMCHCVDDELNDDFKVVKFAEYWNFEDFRERRVMVYSLRNNSWRTVEFKHTVVETYVSLCGGAPVVVQNHLLHLIFFDKNSDVMTRIGCFDMKAERWANDVPLPDILTSETGPKYTRQLDFYISSLDGKLCFASPDGKYSTYDLWVMKEYGVKESWVKLMSLPIPNGLDKFMLKKIAYRPFAYLKESRHKVWCQGENGVYFLYNLRDKEIITTRYGRESGFRRNYLCKGSLLDFQESQPIPLLKCRRLTLRRGGR